MAYLHISSGWNLQQHTRCSDIQCGTGSQPEGGCGYMTERMIDMGGVVGVVEEEAGEGGGGGGEGDVDIDVLDVVAGVNVIIIVVASLWSSSF